MGRYATPLITSPLLPLAENGVEVLICEARLAHQATDDPEDVEEEQLMTVLVMFEPQPAQRYEARNLAGTYIAAQSMFKQLPDGCDLTGWLLGVLNSRISASLYIVLSLPPIYTDETARQIESVLAGLRNSHYHQLGLAIAVSQTPEEWGHCIGIDGFVSADKPVSGRESLNVFNMLAAFMAPGLSSCVDWEELRSVFGNHRSPSRVASGAWMDTKAAFVWATSDNQELVKNCKAIASMPSRCLQIESQHKLMKEICKSTANDSVFVMIAPYGLSSEPFLVDQIVPVTLIAAFDTKEI